MTSLASYQAEISTLINDAYDAYDAYYGLRQMTQQSPQNLTENLQ